MSTPDSLFASNGDGGVEVRLPSGLRDVLRSLCDQLETLLTCPLHTPVTVTRVTDQDAAFLRFIEGHQLKPGQTIEVEARDDVSDSVRLRSPGGQPITIGTRAASKLLVEVR